MIGELSDALVEHIRTVLEQSMSTLKTRSVFLSISNDEDSHLKQAEDEFRATNPRGGTFLPFAVVIRQQLEPLSMETSPRSPQGFAQQVVHSIGTDGKPLIVKARPVTIRHQLRIYVSNMDEMDELVNLWLLMDTAEEIFKFKPSFLNEQIDVNLVFEPAETFYPELAQRSESGLYLYQDFPFVVSTVLVSVPALSKRIQRATHSYYDGNSAADATKLEDGKPVV